jgi:hypothetical protein
VLAGPRDAERILQRLGELSAPFGARVEIQRQGERCFGRIVHG